jgi:hypothetical protein
MQHKIEGIKSANGMKVKRVYIFKKGISTVRQLKQKAVIRKAIRQQVN